MKKYLLIACILLTNNSYDQLIIGDLQIEPTNKPNQIKITNISSKPIDKIIMDGKVLPDELRVLQPNQSKLFIFTPKTKEEVIKEEKEKKVLADLLRDKKTR